MFQQISATQTTERRIDILQEPAARNKTGTKESVMDPTPRPINAAKNDSSEDVQAKEDGIACSSKPDSAKKDASLESKEDAVIIEHLSFPGSSAQEGENMDRISQSPHRLKQLEGESTSLQEQATQDTTGIKEGTLDPTPIPINGAKNDFGTKDIQAKEYGIEHSPKPHSAKENQNPEAKEDTGEIKDLSAPGSSGNEDGRTEAKDDNGDIKDL